jgi:hypothetical protein
LAPLGDVFFSVSAGFFQRGMSAMMTFFGISLGGSELVLAGSLVIVFPLTFYEEFSGPDNLTKAMELSLLCWRRWQLAHKVINLSAPSEPIIAGYVSSGGGRAGSLSSRNIGIASRRDLKRQLSTEHLLATLRPAMIACDAILRWPSLTCSVLFSACRAELDKAVDTDSEAILPEGELTRLRSLTSLLQNLKKIAIVVSPRTNMRTFGRDHLFG